MYDEIAVRARVAHRALLELGEARGDVARVAAPRHVRAQAVDRQHQDVVVRTHFAGARRGGVRCARCGGRRGGGGDGGVGGDGCGGRRDDRAGRRRCRRPAAILRPIARRHRDRRNRSEEHQRITTRGLYDVSLIRRMGTQVETHCRMNRRSRSRPRCEGVAGTPRSSFFPCEGVLGFVRFPFVLPLRALRSGAVFLFRGRRGASRDFVKGEGRCETSNGFVTDLASLTVMAAGLGTFLAACGDDDNAPPPGKTDSGTDGTTEDTGAPDTGTDGKTPEVGTPAEDHPRARRDGARPRHRRDRPVRQAASASASRRRPHPRPSSRRRLSPPSPRTLAPVSPTRACSSERAGRSRRRVPTSRRSRFVRTS